MPGRKASSDSDLAVQFVLSGQGKAADAKKKWVLKKYIFLFEKKMFKQFVRINSVPTNGLGFLKLEQFEISRSA